MNQFNLDDEFISGYIIISYRVSFIINDCLIANQITLFNVIVSQPILFVFNKQTHVF